MFSHTLRASGLRSFCLDAAKYVGVFVAGIVTPVCLTATPLITEYGNKIYGPGGGDVSRIAMGADGNCWYSTFTSYVGYVTPEGEVHSIDTGGSGTSGITRGPDGNMWVVDFDVNMLIRITPKGDVMRFGPYASGAYNFFDVTVGPDGNLWTSGFNGSTLRRFTLGAGDTLGVTEFTRAGLATWAVTPGPDGNVWFTEPTLDKVGFVSTGAHGPAGKITEYSTPTGSAPAAIVAGSDGNLWFTEPGANKIGRISPSTGAVTEFPIASPDSQPYQIVAGANGTLWFSESHASNIGKIAIAGSSVTLSEFPLAITPAIASDITTTQSVAWASPDTLWVGAGNASGNLLKVPLATIGAGKVFEYGQGIDPTSGPVGITPGVNGDLWITAVNWDELRRITTDGVISIQGKYFVGDIDSKRPFSVIADAKGLWFGELNSSSIGRMLWDGTVSHTKITHDGWPIALTKGQDDQLWFVEQQANKIGMISAPGSVTEYSIPTRAVRPSGLAKTADGNFWFTENATNKIGKIDGSGNFLGEYDLATGAQPNGIATGPDGNLWFTESGLDQIGRLTPGGVLTEFRGLTSGAMPDAITSGPANALWFIEDGTGKVGRITLQGVVTEFDAFDPGAWPSTIAAGPDGNLWLTEPRTGVIRRLLGDVIFANGVETR